MKNDPVSWSPAEEDEIMHGILGFRAPVYYDYENAEIREFLFRFLFKRFEEFYENVKYLDPDWFRYNVSYRDDSIMQCFMKPANYRILQHAYQGPSGKPSNSMSPRKFSRTRSFPRTSMKTTDEFRPDSLLKMKRASLGIKVHFLAYTLRESFGVSEGDDFYWRVRDKFFRSRSTHPKPGSLRGSDWDDFLNYKYKEVDRYSFQGNEAVFEGIRKVSIQFTDFLEISGMKEVFENYCPIEVQLQMLKEI